jgi:DNA primase
VYSARARPCATVSTPLTWDEIHDDLDPAAFTMTTVLPRVKALGDLWGKGMKRPNSLEGVIGRA